MMESTFSYKRPYPRGAAQSTIFLWDAPLRRKNARGGGGQSGI